MKGRDRNKPCPCGSGKKHKKCHPNKSADWVQPIEEATREFKDGLTK